MLDDVITCHVRYEIDATKVEAFERFARAWMELVERHGGTHHGYFLPSEGASDIAYALFSFSSLADYERYRAHFGVEQRVIDGVVSGGRCCVQGAVEPRLVSSAGGSHPERECAPCAG